MSLTGLLHAIPNDDTSPVKEAVKLHDKPAKKSGEFSEKCVCSSCLIFAVWWRRKASQLFVISFSPECIIKSLINPRNVAKMESTFGTWMKDTARLNDERIWVAEHFSGRLIIENNRDINLNQMSRLCVSKQRRHVRLQDLKIILYREHFACSCPGRVVKQYKSIASFQNSSSDIVDVRKFYQGCGHTVHNGSFYYHIAGTSSIGR